MIEGLPSSVMEYFNDHRSSLIFFVNFSSVILLVYVFSSVAYWCMFLLILHEKNCLQNHYNVCHSPPASKVQGRASAPDQLTIPM